MSVALLGIHPLWWGLGAVALAGSYLALRDETAKCIDQNMGPDLEKLARDLLQPEKGDEPLAELITRTAFMRRSSEIATKQGHPLLGACLLVRAEQLENTIRKAGGVPMLPSALGQERANIQVAAQLPASKASVRGASAVQAKARSATPGAKGVPAQGISFMELPDRPGPEREQMIEQIVRERHIRPFAWMPVDCSRDGIQCTVFVSDDALQLLDPATGQTLRFTVRHDTGERIAKGLGAYLPTSRIEDLSWQQANTRLSPHPQGASPDMSTTHVMIRHNAAVEKERAGRGGLVRTVGKIWALTNKLVGHPERGSNFGWHTKSGPNRSPGGAPIIEPLDLAHGIAHTDYSQILQIVAPTAVVDGKKIPLPALLRHPTLSKTVSDEGPLQIVRHPAVPEGGGTLPVS